MLPVEFAEVSGRPVEVEQCLGQVLMPAVAGVDHRSIGPLHAMRRSSRPMRTTTPSMPMAVIVSMVSRRDSPLLTEELLAEVHRVGRQSLGCCLEAESGPGRVFVEDPRNRLSSKGRHLGDAALPHLAKDSVRFKICSMSSRSRSAIDSR